MIGGWDVVQFGSLAIVKTTSRMQSNAVVSTPWGSLYESQRFALPDYPVTFDAKPWSSVEYVDADDGYRNAAFVEREPVSISTKISE